MAQLTAEQRRELWAEFMRDLSRNQEPLDLLKPELRAAVDAVDQWIDDNQASFNAALPTAARTAMSVGQKARLFMVVAQRRFGVA